MRPELLPTHGSHRIFRATASLPAYLVSGVFANDVVFLLMSAGMNDASHATRMPNLTSMSSRLSQG